MPPNFYKLILTPEAQRNLHVFDKRYQKAVFAALQRLEINPQLGKPLKGELKGKWRIRFSRYRIIYHLDYHTKRIWVLNIEHRKDIYR